MWRISTNSTSSSSSRNCQEDNLKYNHPTPHHAVVYISKRLAFIMVGCILFGVLLLFINVLQLRSLSKVSLEGESMDNRPIVWVYAKNLNSGYLDHVLAVFRRVGHVKTESSGQKWDLLWSHDYPFSFTEISKFMKELEPHQKVNHFPGSGFITNKASLAVSHFSFQPSAFVIPKEKERFLQEVKKFPKKMWVEKSNSHRGIHIKSPSEINLNGASNDAFVEEFISNPYLINGRKCDIGIYTVLTSIKPLRVYIYEDEVLIRCCIQDYKPLDVNNEKQYVVADEYTQPWDLDSLRFMWNKGSFSRKQMYLTHLNQNGKDGVKAWKDMKDAIREVYVKKELDLIPSSVPYGSSRNFFELVRFDFILDENANVWLMEVNMSPNLSSASHSDNAVMYEQVVFNTLGLIGAANRLGHSIKHGTTMEKDMVVSNMDIVTSFDQCVSRECKNSCIHEMCQLCNSCLTEDQKAFLKEARREHVNRGGFRRVYPPPMSETEARNAKKQKHHLSNSNQLMDAWFRQMCIRDPTFCY